MGSQHEGIVETILRFEKAELPRCLHCGSTNTADVRCGVIGRTIYIAAATSKVKLIANGPKPGNYWCNSCEAFFDK